MSLEIHLEVAFVPFAGADSESRWWLAIETLVKILMQEDCITNEGDCDVEVEERVCEGESARGVSMS